ncbi:DUF2824 family protein [Candidatus Pacearchaeota archaeon]|nr:DUF2824 family protein [Candidatus Pacearchaeota archaeon]
MDTKIIATICEDMAFVKHVIWSIWDETCADPAKDQAMFWEPDPKDIWILFSVGTKRLGVYRLHRFNDITYQLCANVLPCFRKKYTYDITRTAHEFLLENMPESMTKLVAFIPEYFKNVISYANKSGWKTEGKITKSFLRDGKLYDTVHVGITKEELRQWLQ